MLPSFSFKAIFAIWLVYALVVLTAVVGLVWAAFHFISKFW